MSNWNLKSFDNLYASLAESAYRDSLKIFSYEWLDQIQEERSKLKWEYDNEIDAFYKNQKKLESKDKKISKVALTDFFSWFQMMLYLRHCLLLWSLGLVRQTS